MRELRGYRRPDGSWGVRNYVVVLSMVHCANTACQKIADQTDTAAIVHDMGCMEGAGSHALTVQGLVGAGRNPNVYGAVLVGLGCEQTDHARIARQLEERGKECAFVSIQEEGGFPEAVAKGVALAKAMKARADEAKREPMPLSALTVGVQCGGSDWTTAISGNPSIGAMSDLLVEGGGSVLMSEVEGFPGSEHIVAAHAANPRVGLEILQMVDELRRDFMQHNGGQSIADVNPTPGNKEGGITTLVEKSMGNIKKMGSKPLRGILKIGEGVPRPGLYIIDNRCEGPDTFNVSSFAMAGAQMTVFSSGRGSPIGNAVMPVVKLTGNPERFAALNSLFDFDSGMALEGKTIAETGAALLDRVIEIANGAPAKNEINGNREFSIPR